MERREGIDQVAEQSVRWSVSRGDMNIEVLFLERREALPEEPSGSLARYIRSAGFDKEIGVTVYPDRRGSGYGISRYEDHTAMDYSLLEGESDVHFAHKSGFMCKTSATEPEQLKAIIQAAIRS
ncbi:MAG: hypothetical protein ACI8TQ_001963 [Planctomycetota bacterium]|jgi:hypothetical protein